jgi:hypothetical protein
MQAITIPDQGVRLRLKKRKFDVALPQERKPELKNRVPQEIEDAIVAIAVEQPAFDQVRIGPPPPAPGWSLVSSTGGPRPAG